ncbi:hypothetical protein ACMGE5_10225 [Macrococcus equi]|uniref:hypothetical protein n=1 Tax=Macrococcus equi TaxID=3395462 RepID=UPI0039BE61F2
MKYIIGFVLYTFITTMVITMIDDVLMMQYCTYFSLIGTVLIISAGLINNENQKEI